MPKPAPTSDSTIAAAAATTFMVARAGHGDEASMCYQVSSIVKWGKGQCCFYVNRSVEKMPPQWHLSILAASSVTCRNILLRENSLGKAGLRKYLGKSV